MYLNNNNDALRVQAKNMLEIMGVKYRIDARKRFCSLKKQNDSAIDLAFIECLKSMPSLKCDIYKEAESEKYVDAINRLRSVSISVLGDEMERAVRGGLKERLFILFI